jgi:hypothetical protein
VNYPTLSLPYPGTDRGNSKLQAANEAAVAAAKAAKAAAVAPDSKYQMLLSIDADVKADAAAEAAGIPKVTQGLNMGQARAALAAALVPPLALLTLGLAIRWVVAGLKT